MKSNICELFYNEIILRKRSHHVFEILVAAEFFFLRGFVLWQCPVRFVWWMPVSMIWRNWGKNAMITLKWRFMAELTKWFSDIELQVICTDQCETKNLVCISNCPADDYNCIRECLKEETQCIDSMFHLWIIFHDSPTIFKIVPVRSIVKRVVRTAQIPFASQPNVRLVY